MTYPYSVRAVEALTLIGGADEFYEADLMAAELADWRKEEVGVYVDEELRLITSWNDVGERVPSEYLTEIGQLLVIKRSDCVEILTEIGQLLVIKRSDCVEIVEPYDDKSGASTVIVDYTNLADLIFVLSRAAK